MQPRYKPRRRGSQSTQPRPPAPKTIAHTILDEAVEKHVNAAVGKQLEAAMEKQLASLTSEHRLKGLGPDNLILSLPAAVLQALALSEAYLASLPPEVQKEVRRRIRKGSH